MSVKNSNDIFGNRTRDLPACSAVPQLARSREPLGGGRDRNAYSHTAHVCSVNVAIFDNSVDCH